MSRGEHSTTKLKNLHVSGRYANYESKLMLAHHSTTKKAKHDAGHYDNTIGHYGQAGYRDAMRAAPQLEALAVEDCVPCTPPDAEDSQVTVPPTQSLN